MKQAGFLFVGMMLCAGLACGDKQPEHSANQVGKPAVKLVKIKVSGMTCAGCTSRVEALIKKLPGVKGCKASVPDKNVQVKYDAAKVQLASIEKTIESQGYKVVK